MVDRFDSSAGERLDLTDADLVFWPRIELDGNPDAIMQSLIDSCDWRQERIVVYGKPYLQPRLSAWHGDLPYRYSGIRLEPQPWTPLLERLRRRVEGVTACRFNSVLLNLYRDGNDSMGLHSDDERELGARPAIASLSLGGTRDFIMRHRHRRDLESLKIPLHCGSLLLMRGDTQRNWRHGINRTRRDCGARLNLTFRRVFPPDVPGRRA